MVFMLISFTCLSLVVGPLPRLCSALLFSVICVLPAIFLLCVNLFALFKERIKAASIHNRARAIYQQENHHLLKIISLLTGFIFRQNTTTVASVHTSSVRVY
jgi:hypothetical protein